MSETRVRTIVVVGAGPRGVGVVERLAAHAGSAPVSLHVVDPHFPGGRVWRRDQSPLLWMNSPADEVTMFTDDSVDCAGPVRPGPTLYAWARTEAAAWLDGSGLADEARSLGPGGVASRRLCGAYLAWCLDRSLRSLPRTWCWRIHRSAARTVRADARRELDVVLEDGTRIRADRVVLAVGNLDGSLSAEQRRTAAHARACGGHYIPPGYTADLDLAGIPPGQDVLVRGLGLAFLDLMILVTEGRGGRFRRRSDGSLGYRPSGREPVLHVSSPRGMPPHPRPVVPSTGGAPGPPVFATEHALRSVLEPALSGGDRETCRRAAQEVWQLLTRDMARAHYAELFTARPEDTALPRGEFERRFRAAAFPSAELDALIEEAVPAPEDRFRAAEDRPHPLLPERSRNHTELNRHMREHLRASVLRATDPRYSTTGAAHRALVVAVELAVAVLTERGPALTEEAVVIAESMAALAREAGAGAPAERVEQLCALHDAGLVRFLGRNPRLSLHDEGFEMRAHPLSNRPVRSAWLVDAWIPDSDTEEDRTGLLPGLVKSGGARTADTAGRPRKLEVCGRTFQVIDSSGMPDPRMIALGDFASGGALGALSQPGTNAAFFRQNDCVARELTTSHEASGPRSEYAEDE
ncbi:FAD/NAD(P)-binding protein [Streptomyces sp. NPDC055607]